jgi:hypothetical protein
VAYAPNFQNVTRKYWKKFQIFFLCPSLKNVPKMFEKIFNNVGLKQQLSNRAEMFFVLNLWLMPQFSKCA